MFTAHLKVKNHGKKLSDHSQIVPKTDIFHIPNIILQLYVVEPLRFIRKRNHFGTFNAGANGMAHLVSIRHSIREEGGVWTRSDNGHIAL